MQEQRVGRSTNCISSQLSSSSEARFLLPWDHTSLLIADSLPESSATMG